MAAPASTATIPEARFDDLDLDREEDRVEWRRRLAVLAGARLSSARARFERLGIVDADGKLVSNELPPDMLRDSDTTLDTGEAAFGPFRNRWSSASGMRSMVRQ